MGRCGLNGSDVQHCEDRSGVDPVVIAAVMLPGDKKDPIQAADISYAPRRVLWSVSDLMALLS
jgi:hypothetical protein